MKTTHYGIDYCYVTINGRDIEVPISIGQGVDRLNKRIEELKSDGIKKARERNLLAACR